MRPVTLFAFAYFIAMTIACTFPFLNLVTRVRPFVFGVPFMMAWFAGWVIGALFVFLMLYRSETHE